MITRQSKEFTEFCSRAAGAVAVATAGLVSDTSDPQTSYRTAIRFVFSILGAFILDSRDIGGVAKSCASMRDVAIGRGSWSKACAGLISCGETTGVDLLKSTDGESVPAKHARVILRQLLGSGSDPAISSVYFGSIPANWISLLYEYLLDRRPEIVPDPPGVRLRADSSSRKRNGAFFTPGYIIDYIVHESLGRVSDPVMARVLDPAMGAGDFLVGALHRLSESADPGYIATWCIYGCDIDPIAVDIARFLLWLESGGRADASMIASHLVCADALSGNGELSWNDRFPDAFGLFAGYPGFDAVIGNPPYVAAKNSAMADYQAVHGVKGQSDYYLLFLESVIAKDLVKPGGALSMVLPDPFLVRTNATAVREKLLKKWTVRSVVHVAGAFPGAHVANIILVAANTPSDGRAFPVLRLETTPDRKAFELDPKLATFRQARTVRPSFALAQPRSEVLYLVDSAYEGVFERIHGPEKSLTNVATPFVFLNEVDIVDRVFRGEEIGKRKIAASAGDMPILLGGESIHRGRTAWEGLGISREAVRKPLDWYSGPKIVLQKSSARVVAAYDDHGFVVPQSVYGIKLGPGKYHYLYLLAILNSRLMSDYVFRAFTGYKMVQPQIELEDVRRLPIRSVDFEANPIERLRFVSEAVQVFEDELKAGTTGFDGLAARIRELLKIGHSAAVHDILAHIASRAFRTETSDEFIATETERTQRAMNSVVNILYLG